MDARLARTAAAAIVASSLLGAARPTAAQTAPACAGAKLDASALATVEAMGCYGYAAGRGLSIDPACVARAEARLASLFGWIESRGGCEATGDVGTYQARIATCAGLFADGATSWSPRQPCLGAKLAAAGGAAGAGLACFADAARGGAPPPASCLADAERVLASGFDLVARRGQCRDVSDLPAFLADLAACLDPFGPEGEPPVDPVACGDTAGPGGADVPCTCGDAVVTDTALSAASDPVVAAGASCAADGLVVAAGVTLDLGENTIAGSGAGVGLAPGAGATVRNGTVDGFATGVDTGGATTLAALSVTGSAGDGVAVGAALTATDVEVSGSGGSGLRIDTDAAVTLTRVDVHGGAAAGIQALRAGSLLVESSTVHDNAGDGVVLGDVALQTGAVVAKVVSTQIFGNAIGLRAEQKDAFDQELAVAPTRWALVANDIHGNRGAGVQLRTSHPLVETDGTTRLQPFRQNEIFYNAIADASLGCQSPQASPQVIVFGRVAESETLAACYGLDQSTCHSREADACYWATTACVPVWDLRGTRACSPLTTGDMNRIHSYNTTTDNTEYSVGMYAETGAFVWADNNVWREPGSNFTENVDQASGGFVDADTGCGGTVLSCVSSP